MNSLLMDAKFRFGLIVIVIAASLAFAAACGSQSGSSKPAAQADGAIPGALAGANAGWLSGPVAEPIAPEIVVLRAGGPANVELSVVEDAASLAAAHVKVDVAYDGDTAAVRIYAKGAPEVENALFELRYDMAGYGPDEWRMGEFMTRGAEGVFEDLTVGSTITMKDGVIAALIPSGDHLGIAISRVRPDLYGGASGSGLVVEIVLAKASVKSASAAPRIADGAIAVPDEGSDARTSSAETGGGFWDWEYGTIMPAGTEEFPCAAVLYKPRFPGDADRNNRVTIADITPIAVHYLKEVEWIDHNYSGLSSGSPPEIRPSKADADLNRDGVVDILDINVIAMNYGMEYYPDHLASRPAAGGEWSPIYELSEPAPNLEVTPVNSELYAGRYADGILDSVGLEYGIPYYDPLNGLLRAFPLVNRDFGGLIWDNYFGKIEGREYTEGEEPEWYLVIEFDMFGDYGGDGYVSVPDMTYLALSFPVFLDNLFIIGLPNLIPFYEEISAAPLAGDVLLPFFTAIGLNYRLEKPKHYVVEYFDVADALTPIWTEESYTDALNDYWQYGDFWEDGVSRIYTPTHSIPAPPLSGTLYAEVTAYMRLDNSHPLVPVKYPTRVELYFPPVTGEEEGL